MSPKRADGQVTVLDAGTGQGGSNGHEFGPGGGSGWSPALPSPQQQIYLTGISLAVLAIGMFFLALTSAFIVRKGLSDDWQAFGLPQILWLNTTVLAASSFTIERARRKWMRGHAAEFRRWWLLTTALGVLFLAGQLIAWRELRAAGVYLATNPSSSFFYLLTAAHALHLAGGLVALSYVGWLISGEDLARRVGTASRTTAIYWHFLDGLWVVLFLLLLLGR